MPWRKFANAGESGAHLSRDDVLRAIAQRGEELREVLARNPQTDPRVLTFLAEEGTPASQRAVAANPGTPAATNRMLAASQDGGVRAELALKLGRLFPSLSQDVRTEVRRLTLETLECLAEDALPHVRAILAEEIKHLDCVPKALVVKLARDVECVAAPVLEYSPLLNDADLVDIVTSAGAHHALLAIAKRRPLAESVSEAIAAAMDVPAVAALLANPDAAIRTQTLDKLSEQAAAIGAWQAPLVLRAGLSQRALKRIASFAGASLLERLAARHDLSEELRSQLRVRLQARLGGGATQASVPAKPGKIEDGALIAAAQDGRRDAVIEAICSSAQLPRETVERVFATKQAKPVTALVWRAGFNMRAAFRIQTCLLHLPAAETLPAREGVHFPMDEQEMRWHLRYFGIDA